MLIELNLASRKLAALVTYAKHLLKTKILSYSINNSFHLPRSQAYLSQQQFIPCCFLEKFKGYIQCPRHSIISQDIVQCQNLASRLHSNCTNRVTWFQSTPSWMVGFWIVRGSDLSGLIGSTWRRNNSAEGLSTLRMPWSGPYPAINICTKILLTSVVVLSTKWWQDVVTATFLIIGFPLRSMDIGSHCIAKAWFWALKADIVFLQQGAHNCQIYFWQRQRFIFNTE